MERETEPQETERAITLDSAVGPRGENSKCKDCGEPSHGWRYCDDCDWQSDRSNY